MQSDRPTYQYELEYISPATAAEYLKVNGKNRVISLSGVRRLSDAMSNGRWMNEAAQTIIFDTDGMLRDGQHRLTSSVKSQVGFWAIVVRNMPPEAFAVLDTGKRRSAADVLGTMGVTYAAITASASKYALNYIEGVGLRTSRDNDEVAAFVAAHPDMEPMAARCYPTRVNFGPSPFAAVMYLAARQRNLGRKIDKFIDGVIGRADVPYTENDPRRMLREWAMRELHRQKGAIIRPEPLMMATSLAWAAFAQGKPIQNVGELTSKKIAHRSTMPIFGYSAPTAHEQQRGAA